MGFFSKKIFIIFILWVSLLSACSIKKTASSLTGKILADSLPLIESEEDIELALSATLNSLKVLELLHQNKPKDNLILQTLSQAYASYAFAAIEMEVLKNFGSNDEAYQKASDRAKLFYNRGKNYGLEALSQNASFKKALNSNFDEFELSLKSFSKKEVPLLFWTAFNWASWINYSKDSPEAIADLPRVISMMNRVKELDENYNQAGVHQFLGVFHASKPAMLGGQPEEAKKEFEKAFSLTQRNYLMIQVLYAQFYLVQTQQKEEFRKVLNEVLQADLSVLPKQKLANSLAKQKAELLLKKEKHFF